MKKIEKEIKKKQNDEFNKKCQFVSRYYYNCAEKINYLSWILFLLSFSSIFIDSEEILFLLGILVIDLFAFICNYCIVKYNEKATIIRNYFDHTLFSFESEFFSPDEVRKIREWVHNVSIKKSKECNIQISNDAMGSPPGVSDWYEVDVKKSHYENVFECQQQNIWWEKHMIKGKIVIHSIFLIVCVCVILYALMNIGLSLTKIFLSSILIFKVIDVLIKYIKYFCISKEIDGMVKILVVTDKECGVSILQTKIEERRRIPLQNMHVIHKMMAKKMSALYKKIINE